MSSIIADPFAMIRHLRNMEAGESQIGCMATAVLFVICITNLTVSPTSQPDWSARLKRMSRTPFGENRPPDCGWKEHDRRSVTYEAVLRPAKLNESINLSSDPEMWVSRLIAFTYFPNKIIHALSRSSSATRGVLFRGFLPFIPGMLAAALALGAMDTFLTMGFRLPCGAALGTRLLAGGLVVCRMGVGVGVLPMAAAVAAGLCMLLGFFRVLT